MGLLKHSPHYLLSDLCERSSRIDAIIKAAEFSSLVGCSELSKRKLHPRPPWRYIIFWISVDEMLYYGEVLRAQPHLLEEHTRF